MVSFDHHYPPANRQRYGQYDSAEEGAPNFDRATEDALRRSGWSRIFGNTLVQSLGGWQGPTYNGTTPTPGRSWYDPRADGGVRTGNVGIMPTTGASAFMGVLRGWVGPPGIPTDRQTLLAQWQETPLRYDGDVSLELAPLYVRPAPWRRKLTPGG